MAMCVCCLKVEVWLQGMPIQFSQYGHSNVDIKTKSISNQQMWGEMDKFGYMMCL